jgi:hypothetical protein
MSLVFEVFKNFSELSEKCSSHDTFGQMHVKILINKADIS